MKNDDNYSLKELLQEVREQNRSALVTQTTILSTIESINEHLEQLNSKVAKQEKRTQEIEDEIGSLKMFESKVMVVWSFIVFVIVTAVNKIMSII